MASRNAAGVQLGAEPLMSTYQCSGGCWLCSVYRSALAGQAIFPRFPLREVRELYIENYGFENKRASSLYSQGRKVKSLPENRYGYPTLAGRVQCRSAKEVVAQQAQAKAANTDAQVAAAELQSVARELQRHLQERSDVVKQHSEARTNVQRYRCSP